MNISEYINSKPEFNLMPFITIYRAIMVLKEDGYIDENAFTSKRDEEDVDRIQSQSER
ncbi:MAG: hypothetical protein J6Q27_02820 [Clostridia bacterium]|nr:hypothetical protein [Clostridia bacterium]